MAQLSHVDSDGKAAMVDVSAKSVTLREAEACGSMHISAELGALIQNNQVQKGDVFAVARIAGIQAAKKTAELIPLCHNIFISHVGLEFDLDKDRQLITIKAIAKTNSSTGIEMEALTAVSVAALTIYDMCKAVDKSIRISDIHLVRKSGGRSGDYLYQSNQNL